MSEERELLRETVAALVDKHAPPAAVRESMTSERGYDESLWRLLCEQVMGRGREHVLPPRLPLTGERRAQVIRLVETAAASRPG